ncbi:MAG: hypothetical protein ACQSGP_23000 [Frankia sp.]
MADAGTARSPVGHSGRILDRADLPLSGLSVELVASRVGLLRWRLSGGGAEPGVVERALDRTPILGWRSGASPPAGPAPGAAFTAAWGSLLGGTGPLRVVLARRRPLRRRSLRHELEPVTLGDAFWIAETEGAFDQLVVSDGAVVETRDLRAVA